MKESVEMVLRCVTIFFVSALLWLTIFTLSGCVLNSYEHIDYDFNGKLISRTKLDINYAMINATAGVFMANVDGAFFLVIDANVMDSPESAEAIGKAIANGMSGGASGVIGEIAK
jgi:hypothetical protein